MTEDPKPKVTLEQLLQLKREEKPPEEFWEEFDRSFHRRRLQALVNGEGNRWTRALVRFAYALVPVSVTAVAAMGFFVFQASDSIAPARGSVASEQPGRSPFTPLQTEAAESVAWGAQPATTSLGNFFAEPARTLTVASASWETLPEEAASRFIMDSLPANASDNTRFRLVQHSPLLEASPSRSARYVADPITVKRSDAFPVSYRPTSDF